MAKDPEQELDFESLDPSDPAHWQQLRGYAERQRKQGQRAAELERENAFLRAGVNTDSRLGKAFAATYAGKLDDIEAIRADALDFSPAIVATVGEARPAEPAAQTPPGTPAGQPAAPTEPAPQPTGSTERQNLADGATTGSGEEDIKATSIARGKQLIADGKPEDVAVGELIAMRARAVHEGKLAALDSSGRPTQMR